MNSTFVVHVYIWFDYKYFFIFLGKVNIISLEICYIKPTNMCLNTSTTNNNREGRGPWQMFYAHYFLVVQNKIFISIMREVVQMLDKHFLQIEISFLFVPLMVNYKNYGSLVQ